MNSFNGTDPKKFIADFPRSFHDELVNSSPMGQRMDRDKLIAHTRPVRKNRPSGRMEVREAVANGDRIAARMRRGHCAGFVTEEIENIAVEEAGYELVPGT